MQVLETTNGLLARVMEDVEHLARWADADAEMSMEFDAPEQARDDYRRAGTLRMVLSMLNSCQR